MPSGRFKNNQEGLELNGTNQQLFYSKDVTILGRIIHTVKISSKALLKAVKKDGLEVDTEITKYVVISRHQNSGKKIQTYRTLKNASKCGKVKIF
jgi:hypothetical protein